MSYNKSEIMKRAWTLYRNRNRLILEQLGRTKKDSQFYPLIKKNVIPFADCLKQAWADAKEDIAKARAVAVLSVSDKARLDGLKKELLILECKDRWNNHDSQRAGKLQAQIKELETKAA